MKLNFSREAANFAAIQELPGILQNPKVHYRVHNSPPPVPILTQINPAYTTSCDLSKIHLNVINSPTYSSS
jgi:hypothetical protein